MRKALPVPPQITVPCIATSLTFQVEALELVKVCTKRYSMSSPVESSSTIVTVAAAISVSIAKSVTVGAVDPDPKRKTGAELSMLACWSAPVPCILLTSARSRSAQLPMSNPGASGE